MVTGRISKTTLAMPQKLKIFGLSSK